MVPHSQTPPASPLLTGATSAATPHTSLPFLPPAPPRQLWVPTRQLPGRRPLTLTRSLIHWQRQSKSTKPCCHHLGAKLSLNPLRDLQSSGRSRAAAGAEADADLSQGPSAATSSRSLLLPPVFRGRLVRPPAFAQGCPQNQCEKTAVCGGLVLPSSRCTRAVRQPSAHPCIRQVTSHTQRNTARTLPARQWGALPEAARAPCPCPGLRDALSNQPVSFSTLKGRDQGSTPFLCVPELTSTSASKRIFFNIIKKKLYDFN